MPASVEIFDTPEALGAALARDTLAALTQDGLPDKEVLLGCPGGRSLRETYRALGNLAAKERLDLSRLIIVMMDEYLVPNGSRLVRCDSTAHYSCRRFGEEDIRAAFNAGLPLEKKVPAKNVWLPDPADPPEYDRWIEDAGGIALFLLASGASDGHVAFNPPGTERRSRTHIVQLAESTRRDNLKTFPEFRTLADVPEHGVSVGIATIVEHSRRAALVLTGREKRLAAERVLAANSYHSAWPSSVIHECAGGRILLDRAAAGAAA
jgi:glucosamine-6-phosphate deaminase